MRNIFDIKSYMVFLGRNKAYTFITVIGLSVSLAFMMLIGVYVWQESSTNSDNPDAENIYALDCVINKLFGQEYDQPDHMLAVHPGMQRLILGTYQQVESTCSVSWDELYTQKSDGVRARKNTASADSNFFRMFRYDFLQGTPEDFAAHTNAAVLTERCAKDLFGPEDPMGKVFTIESGKDKVSVLVTGIISDNNHTSFEDNLDIFVRLEAIIDPDFLNDSDFGSIGSHEVYLKVAPGTDAKTLEAQIDANFRKVIWILGNNNETYNYDNEGHVELLPLKDVYFTNAAKSASTTGDKRMINILILAGLVVLLFSVTNYINLTVAKSADRAREMATRRLMGSSKGDIALKMMVESFTLCLISTLIAAVLCIALAPAFGKLIGTSLELAWLGKPMAIVLILATLAVVSIFSGAIPAIVLSRVKPVDVVRGSFRQRNRMVLSKVFITLQSCITIVLIGVSLTMLLQSNKLINAPLGYDRDAIIEVTNPYSYDGDESDKQRFFTLAAELKQLPCAEAVSICTGSPVSTGRNQMAKYRGQTVRLQRFYGDSAFLNILGLKLKNDYGVSDEDGVYITESVFDKTFTPRDSRTFLNNGDETSFSETFRVPIRGVLEDFVLGDIAWGYQSASCTIIYISDKESIPYPTSILIKVKGDLAEGYKAVQEVYKRIYNAELEDTHPYLDQKVEWRFQEQKRAAGLMGIFTAIAVVISFLGLVAMSTYFISQRRKEIAVRKVFGGQSKQVMNRLVGSFLVYVIVAFVIAVPVIWYLMAKWLSEYSYRISLSPWIFLASGAFALLVSFIAVFVQSKAAADANPVDGIVENQ